MTSLFIFHRDLRVVDNKALLRMVKAGATRILPIFIFTPDQVDHNPYFSDHAFQFMCQSLSDLRQATGRTLTCFHGDEVKIVESLIRELGDVNGIAFNTDYTRYAKQRTANMEKLCKKWGIPCILAEDYTLLEMHRIRDGGYYSVFRPYFDRVRDLDKEIQVSRKRVDGFVAYRGKMKQVHESSYFTLDKNIQPGGRKAALRILSTLGKFRDYDKTRNNPSIDTTRLSPHIKFGTVSIREVYERADRVSIELVRQVVWHDFYAQLMNYLPYHQTLGGGNFQNKKITWSSKPTLFKKWCDGRTGFPIVDAGMRQLNATGWMQNRVRLITSNFLTLVMGIDWRKGEKYFAQKLVDYDPSSNNGNWQFTAQVGIDRVPYLRIYNPFQQAKDYDPSCTYIKRWIPELMKVDKKIILNWNKITSSEWKALEVEYPLPVIDYEHGRRESERKYKK